MKAVLEYIRVQESRFAEHVFFHELRQDLPVEQALAFAPRLAFWVMSFQDVLRLNAQRVRDPELRRLMLRHHAEERGHDDWFFEDVALLTGRPLSEEELWSRAHESTRNASHAIISEVFRPLDDRLRVVLVLTLESTSHAFFHRTAALTTDKRLKYFSNHHVEAEEQHEVFEEEMKKLLHGLRLTPALQDEALALVDRVYAAFHTMFDGLRGAALPLTPPVQPTARAVDSLCH